jgi:hypothetical protein
MLTPIEKLKIILRESEVEFFTNAELEYYLNENRQSVNDTAYQCLIIKSENNSLAISGLSTSDTSNYFKRLAARYKPRNSGILKGGF